jgi:hypothetical protein
LSSLLLLVPFSVGRIEDDIAAAVAAANGEIVLFYLAIPMPGLVIVTDAIIGVRLGAKFTE